MDKLEWQDKTSEYYESYLNWEVNEDKDFSNGVFCMWEKEIYVYSV